MSNIPKTGKTRYEAFFYDRTFNQKKWCTMKVWADNVLDAFKVVRKYCPNAASISIKVYKPKDKI